MKIFDLIKQLFRAGKSPVAQPENLPRHPALAWREDHCSKGKHDYNTWMTYLSLPIMGKGLDGLPVVDVSSRPMRGRHCKHCGFWDVE